MDEAPDVSGPSTRNFPENSTDVVATFRATDPEGATPIAWDIVESAGDPDGDGDLGDADNADAASFEIDEDGVLKFINPPDFENPASTNATDNTYKVVVVACDVALVSNACPASPDGQAGYHAVTVNVTPVNETGEVTLTTNTSGGTPQYLVGAELTAGASDGDIDGATKTFTDDSAAGVSGVVWRWYRGGTEITDSDAQDNTYTLQAADANNRIRVVVTYQVAGNTRQETASKTTDYPVLAGRTGDSQLKFEPAEVSRTISEGAKGRNVGTPVTATGNHGTIRYTLAGTDGALFDIDDKTGQIKTNVVLDYEGETPATADAAGSCSEATGGTPDRECIVTVTATDSTGAVTSTAAANLNATVTIRITNVDEKPEFSTTGAQTVTVPENSTALWHASTTGYTATEAGTVTYTATDPEGRTVNYSLTGPDASKFQPTGTPPVLSFVSGPDFEAKASADRDNVYEVTVRATAGGKTGERKVRVTVGQVDEAPEIMEVTGPVVRGPASIPYQENGTGPVATYTPSGFGGTVTWSLTGADSGDFTISGGILRFINSPDHENPADADTNNTYEVTVTARRGSDTDSVNVMVTVNDVDETGPSGSVIDRYDANNSGRIDKGELQSAIFDYNINRTLEKSDLQTLIFNYETGL